MEYNIPPVLQIIHPQLGWHRENCTLKEGLKKFWNLGLDLEDELSMFSPAILRSTSWPLSDRHGQTRLHFIKPNITEAVREIQYQQRLYHDQPVYFSDSSVLALKWIFRVITQQKDHVSFGSENVRWTRFSDDTVINCDPKVQKETVTSE